MWSEAPAHCAARAANVSTLKLLVAEEGGLAAGLLRRRESSKRAGQRRRLGGERDREDSAGVGLLEAACLSESTECVEFLLDEIMSARRGRWLEASLERVFPHAAEELDLREFIELAEPRQALFLELGADLAESNCRQQEDELEKSLYGLMLSKTPQAFAHLLDGCIYSGPGERTYVDLFPFFNRRGMSELTLLRVIIKLKKFDLLTHPLCELLLYLKWLRARWLYWAVMTLSLVYCLLVVAYVLLNYGQLGWYVNRSTGLGCELISNTTGISQNTKYRDEHPGALPCIGKWLTIPVIVSATIIATVQSAKLFQVLRWSCYCAVHWILPSLPEYNCVPTYMSARTTKLA